jgi:hypothetical protein
MGRLSLYPEFQGKLSSDLKEFKRSPLNDARFEDVKERFLVIHSMLQAHHDSPEETKKRAIFTTKDLRGVEGTFIDSESNQGIGAKAAAAVKSVASVFSFKDIRPEARRVSQGEFVTKISALVTDEPVLAAAAAEIMQYFTRKLRERVHELALAWTSLASKAEIKTFHQHQRLELNAHLPMKLAGMQVAKSNRIVLCTYLMLILSEDLDMPCKAAASN